MKLELDRYLVVTKDVAVAHSTDSLDEAESQAQDMARAVLHRPYAIYQRIQKAHGSAIVHVHVETGAPMPWPEPVKRRLDPIGIMLVGAVAFAIGAWTMKWWLQ